MKRFTLFFLFNLRRFALIMFVLAVGGLFHLLWAQPPGDVTPPPGFALVLFVPFGLGMAAHFVKKYLESRSMATPVTFFAWYIQNFGWTITAVVVGVSALYTALNGLPVNVQTIETAFITGFAADSVNQTKSIQA
jgi:hypothetical protein